MYRVALRSASRPAVSGLRAQSLRSAPRRFASTSPANKSRTWKGSAVRWALAGGAVYYYCTSSVFAEEAVAAPANKFSTAPSSFSESSESVELPTVRSVIEERKAQAAAKAAAAEAKTSKQETTGEAASETTAAIGSPAGLEEEADQQGAFNPETGEINWDCPCLGGMAHGPCGEEFKTAFSCFVYSNEEPKGMECIDKFQGMQECFRQYPEIYGAELADAEDAEDFPAGPGDSAEMQTLRENHDAAEKTAVLEHDKEADKQALREEPVPSKTSAVSADQKEPVESKPAESKPAESKPVKSKPADAPAPAAETKIEAPSTNAAHGSKWEDATDANPDALQPTPADVQAKSEK